VSSPPRPAAAASGAARPAVLLVDDRPANLLALSAVLAPLGYDLVQAGSGEEALGLLLERDFALIILDVQMPSTTSASRSTPACCGRRCGSSCSCGSSSS
jgi:CheY-like chemotaxis protein